PRPTAGRRPAGVLAVRRHAARVLQGGCRAVLLCPTLLPAALQLHRTAGRPGPGRLSAVRHIRNRCGRQRRGREEVASLLGDLVRTGVQVVLITRPETIPAWVTHVLEL